MKKTTCAILILLLLALTFPSIPDIRKVSATTTEDLWATPALPENVPREPMPQNFTTDDYLNTSSPYSDYVGIQGALDEVDDSEGNHPLYVLVFGDEEEREVYRRIAVDGWPQPWHQYAKFQLERSDEALMANFGIDIRILGFLEWDSDDSLVTMYDLWYDLKAKTKQYLRTWYEGEWWGNYVDAIIGITAQSTVDGMAGRAPASEYLDQGKIFISLKWQCYWMDDNLVQHEVSHLYYAPDHADPHPPPCDVMAYHYHFQVFIWEDGLWWVYDEVRCAMTSYSWCLQCYQTIQQNSGRYPLEPPNVPSTPSGPTSGYTGTTYSYSTSTTDPEGDDIRYEFSWGDGSFLNVGPYSSGATASASHYWTSTGTKYVKVRAQDSTGAWSNWSPSLVVTITGSGGGGGGGGGVNRPRGADR